MVKQQRPFREKLQWCLMWIMMMNVATLPVAIFSWGVWEAARGTGWRVETSSLISAVVLTLWCIGSTCYAIYVEFFEKEEK